MPARRVPTTAPEDRTVLLAVALALGALILLSGLVRVVEGSPRAGAAEPEPPRWGLPVPGAAATAGQPTAPAVLPHGGTRIFEHGRFLVAYYGTGGTAALGVLGEAPPEVMHRRLLRAAAPFERPGRPVTPVYELIVTVADRTPGPDGDYSHDIDRGTVERYVRAARDRGALLLLDLQPGRADFETVARRWGWALRHPHVGLALDPEWRMHDRGVPGHVIGSVGAAEVNRTSQWLSHLVTTNRLPEKLFVLHQFRTTMVRDIGLVRRRAGLALVQHVDGFGTREEKRATYRTVQHAAKFHMGLKLFYDEDVRRMGPREVHRMRPRISFVSFQ